MPTNFPNNPNIGDTYTLGSNVYIWRGTFWDDLTNYNTVSGFSGFSGASGFSGFTGFSGTSGFSGIANHGATTKMSASGDWVRCPFSITSTNLSTNGAQYHPFWVDDTTTFDRIGSKTATVTTSGWISWAIYANSGGVPTTIVADLGGATFTTSSTFYAININLTLGRGWYWIATGMTTGSATWRGYGAYVETWWHPRAFLGPSPSASVYELICPTLFGGSASGFTNNPTVGYFGWGSMAVWLRIK